jgi:transcriptional regulator with XRE-family HTH domain
LFGARVTTVHFKILRMTELKDRVRALRERKRMSQADLARRVGVTPQAIQAIERGKVKKPQNLTAIAKALSVNPDFLLEGINQQNRLVSVVGIATAGNGAVDYSEGQGNLGETEAPEMSTEHTVALEVRGDSMGGRIEDGDLVFYDDRRQPVTPDLLGKVCVIGRSDGRVVIKKLAAGSRPGHFHLISYNAAPEFDVAVEWAAKVTSIRPK